MSHIELIALGLIGIIAGFINIMAGGGSMLSFPLMIFFGIPGPVANGTLRLSIIAESIAALGDFFRRAIHDLKLSISLSLAALPGALIGARLATKLDPESFNRILAVIMIIVLIIMLLDPKHKVNTQTNSQATNILAGHIAMLFAGIWGGFIQIGVGFLLMPILARLMGLDLVTTNMHKTFIVLFYTVFVIIVLANNSGINWPAGIALALGSIIGALIATHTQVNFGVKWIKSVLYVVLAIFIIRLLL